jgi:hypothetical protein
MRWNWNWICILLLMVFNPIEASTGVNQFEKHHLKLSAGYDLLTLSYKQNFASHYFFQADINPFLLAGSGIVGFQLFNTIKQEIYVGLGAGLSLYGAAYIYPGMGYRYKVSRNHSLFFEGALGFYNIFWYGDFGLERDILQNIRAGYQFSFCEVNVSPNTN